MKKLIKFLIVVLVILIFAFSNNKYVVFVRAKAKVGYELLIDKLKTSNSETVQSVGEIIE